MFRYVMLKRALESARNVTDEASAIEAMGLRPRLVRGDPTNLKVTFPSTCTWPSGFSSTARTRHECSVPHRPGLRRPRPGPRPPADRRRRHDPFERGLLGHSDADVLLHTITDAILGAAGLGDIGRHFPDTDPRFEGADSRVLLREAAARRAPRAGRR
jgi:hypothetical protein